MAFVENKDCPVCRKEQRHVNGKCDECEHRNYLARENAWRMKSYDERLDELRKRIEILEQGPPRY